jgi:hypothetical protein
VTATELFERFVEAHVAGARPDVREYLAQAGAERDELGRLIDRFLSIAPIEPADQEDVVLLTARIEQVTPLTAARTRRSMRVDDVVDQLRNALGLAETSRARLRTAYQELEAEQLDPAGVDERVWSVLQKILGLDPRRLLARPKLAFAPLTYMRTADAETLAAAGAPRQGPPTKLDEVDLLFRAGRVGR